MADIFSGSKQRTWLGSGALAAWQQDLRARGVQSPRLDVLLLTHPRDEEDLPRLFPWSRDLPPESRAELVRHLRPIIGEVIDTPNFTAGLLFLPMFAADIMDPVKRQKCRRQLETEGLELAVAAGSRIICLGGLTGALTGYGRRISERCAQLGLELTTGHAATACSVAATLERAIRDTGRDISEMRVAALGVGSIGSAVCRLLMEKEQRPAEVVLIDMARRQEYLEALAQEMRAAGMAVSIELTTPRGELIDRSACFVADAVISAVSTPYVLDIERVAPATILIDDSQPYCWSREAAWRRCASRLDIVPCDAGLVDCSALGFLSRFPFDFIEARDDGASHTAWSCMTEGLLRAVEPALPAILGEPTVEALRAYSSAFARHRLGVPALQCGDHRVPVEYLGWKRDLMEERVSAAAR